MRDWLASLSNKELQTLKNNITSEQKSRLSNNGRRVYQKTIEMLEDLQEFPPREVAQMYMVSRQYAYYLCKKHSMVPIKNRK